MFNYIIKDYKDSSYYGLLNKNTGFFLRLGYDNVEPFMNNSGPELLDISITNYCDKGCYFCYRKSDENGIHMKIEDYKKIILQAKNAGVLQVALGGGNPNQHPNFVEILKITREAGIIPSYTSNGIGLTEEILKATKKYCGAIAISWNPPYEDTIESINLCIKYRIKTNLHFVLNKSTISTARMLLDSYTDLIKKINAIVFLNYKPVYTTEDDNLKNSTEWEELIKYILNFEDVKIGFDSCMISFLSRYSNLINLETVDFCEASRFSAFISEDLKFYPCSFMHDTGFKGINLAETDLKTAWVSSKLFKDMRYRLSNRSEQIDKIRECKICDKYNICHGGCQILNINACC